MNPFAALKGKGLKDRVLHISDAVWDWRLDVNTFGYVPPVGEFGDAEWQCHYEPTAYRQLFAALRHAGVGPGQVFVDLGCGLGRAVFVAHRLGAKRAIGVEIDARLTAQCERTAVSAGLDPEDVSFICESAEEYAHRDTTVLFMFNPFGPGTMRKVVERVDEALDESPRPLTVVYVNPQFEKVLHSSKRLRRIEQWPGQGSSLIKGTNFPISFWKA